MLSLSGSESGSTKIMQYMSLKILLAMDTVRSLVQQRCDHNTFHHALSNL